VAGGRNGKVRGGMGGCSECGSSQCQGTGAPHLPLK
jgi:hypothetical protein